MTLHLHVNHHAPVCCTAETVAQFKPTAAPTTRVFCDTCGAKWWFDAANGVWRVMGVAPTTPRPEHTPPGFAERFADAVDRWLARRL